MSRDGFPPFDGAQGALSRVEARTAEAGADGRCRRGAFQGGPQSGPRRGCGPQPKNAAAPGARNRGVGGVTRRGPCAVITSSPRYQLGPDRVDGAMSRHTDSCKLR